MKIGHLSMVTPEIRRKEQEGAQASPPYRVGIFSHLTVNSGFCFGQTRDDDCENMSQDSFGFE